MDKQWYFGPEGRLMPLFCPEEGIQMDTVRFGGVHTGLSGAVTRDVTGVRNQYTFNWEKLIQEDYDYLEACNAGLVPGDYYLVNPLKKNRLSVRTSTGAPTAIGRQAIDVGYYYWQWVDDWPADVGFGSRCFKRLGAAEVASPPSSWIRFDSWSRTPVSEGDQIAASVYVKSDYADTWQIGFEYWASGEFSENSSLQSYTLPAGEWTRLTTTVTVPAGITTVVMGLVPAVSYNALQVAAPQIEHGSSATGFALGGGAQRVVIDQMTTASPRFGLYDVELTLLEA